MKITKKQIEKKYNEVLEKQRKSSKTANALSYMLMFNLLAMIPCAFYSLLKFNMLFILLVLGNFFTIFGYYILQYAQYSKLEILELYYLILLRRKTNGRITK